MGGYTDQMGADILRDIGAPVTAANLRRLRAWAKAEGGSASFNPFNTTLSEPGATNYNSFGKNKQYHVRNYPSQTVGEQATAQTLLKTNGGAQYRELVAVLRNPNSTDQQFASAISRSHWGTSGTLVAKILHAPGPIDISTATPSARTGSTPGATSGSTSTTACYWHIPFPGLSQDLCLDNVLWTGMIVGGGLIFVAGAAIVAVGAGMKNPALRTAAETAMVALPVGKVAKAVGTTGAAVKSRTPAGKDTARQEAVFKQQGYDRQRTQTTRSEGLRNIQRARNSTSGGAAVKRASERRDSSRPRNRMAGTGGRAATREEAGF